ncbi:hypothetical protein BG015_003593 [Linnemannia schmuckeri]|uniref:DUF747-domain-containing protein n=1 Tax=Linnemannia schmuckeri TaxID=64567 RepID=A0A9P5S4M2_9FUNG|nr:hypothetical protein BG015_003593 [Linnemannia schmuckeri]
MSTPNPASPSRQPQNGPPPRKHGKKKSRSSWKAGFKSTPSSPSQFGLDGRSTSATATLTELSYGSTNTNTNTNIDSSNASTTNFSTPENTPLKTSTLSNDNNNTQSRTNRNPQSLSDNPENKENRLSQFQQLSSLKVDTSIKDNNIDKCTTTATTTTTTTTTTATKGPSTPRKNEFLQNLDIQLIKLQREEERVQGSSSGSKDVKQTNGMPSASKSGSSTKVFDHELSQLLKTTAPTVAPIGGDDSQALIDGLKLRTLIGSISPPDHPTVSLWDYLKEELTAADFESTQELKRERVANFLSVPIAFEKMLVFGYFVCLDSFLYTFTILPARFMLALMALFRYVFSRTWFSKSKERTRLKSSQKCDLIKVTLVVVACTILQSVDASRTYHFIRGQNAMKLYAIFNCLEIFDRLCCSFGQDILDSLFSKATLGSHPPMSSLTASRHARPITFVLLAILYILAHTMVLFFQMVTLNVAVNSYSNALLTLLISNQFVEIKGSVFKKFEKENLFQLSCSDIVERFQLSVFVTIITIRNLVELSAAPPSPFSVYPQSFVPLFSSMTAVARLLTPCFLVLGCETLVDWLKHAFITKFNQIRPSVYGRFVDILSRDLVVGSPARLAGRNNQQQMFVDQSPMVSRRIGLAALPLACLVICVTIQTLQMVMSTLPSELGGASSSPVMAETFAASATVLTFGQISFKWIMPPIDFTSGVAIASAGIVEALVSFFKVAWLLLGQCLVVVGQVALRWAHRTGFSQELGRKLIEYAVISLACLATFACLVALKMLIGINLLGFAHHRYMTMESRERVERQADRAMRESNAALEEKAASAAVSGMLDGRTAGGQANSDAFGVNGEKRINYGLDTIDRYTLYKSRIP